MRWWCSACGKRLDPTPAHAAMERCSCGSSSRQSWPLVWRLPPPTGNGGTSGLRLVPPQQ